MGAFLGSVHARTGKLDAICVRLLAILPARRSLGEGGFILSKNLLCALCLTMRMQMRRFTRLTAAFSKKIENNKAAIALHYMYHSFCRIHQTLRVAPATEGGLTDHVWSIEELIAKTESVAENLQKAA